MEDNAHTPSKAKVEEKAQFETDDTSRYVNQHRINVKSDLIEITEAILENILLKHLSNLMIRRSWIAPLSIFLAILLANLTATFSKKFGIEAAVWQAVFLILACASCVWLIVSVIRLKIYWKKSTLSNLLTVIKHADEKND